MLTTSLLGLGAALTCLAAAAYTAPFRQPRAITPATPATRNARMDASVWPRGWPHDAPDDPFTVDEAHKTMQRHCGCLRDECPRKAAAYLTLVEAGQLIPDSGRAL